MKKIAFFVSSLNSGGIENYLLRFLRYYGPQIQATVYCKSGKMGDLEEDYKALNVRVVPFKLNYFDFRSFAKLSEEFKLHNYDSVCDFTGNFAGITLCIAQQNKINKRIAFYRGSDNHFKEDLARLAYNYLVKRLVNAYATDILSNSFTALDYFYPGRNKNDRRFEVIYNGIDVNNFISTDDTIREELGIAPEAFVIGHVGRYNSAKNHGTIIEVAVELCRSNSAICFILCGDKVDENLSERVIKEKLQKQIFLLGYRKDVIRILNSLDCFYFPSITEGQPNALIEALVTGLPFVASDIRPIKETLPAEYYGQLVDAKSKDKAMEKILEIYNKEITVDLSKWAIENFNAGFWFEKFYKKL